MSENVALIGADPEVFVLAEMKDHRGRPLGRHEPVPAFGRFGGTKEKPTAMEGLDPGFFYLEDNAALEFNIPPAKTAKEFSQHIATAKEWMATNLLEKQQMMYSDQRTLELLGKYQKDPRGQEVGCSVDFDSYDNEGAQRKPFDGASLGNVRYAGGHFHLAYNVDVLPPFVAARFLDLFLSLPWIEYDTQGARRTTYGKAGLFRPKSYGVEYRTMSNWWVFMPSHIQEKVASAALNFARKTYDEAYLKLLSDAYVGLPWDQIKACVEREDYRAAVPLIDLADRQYSLGIRNRLRR